MIVAARLRSSPVEHELVCSICERPAILAHGYPSCEVHGVRDVAIGDLIRSGRTRPRQFAIGKYPTMEAWR